MMCRRENQLLDHYRDMPERYHCVFANYWFDVARTDYAQQNKEDGNKAMNKARSYGLHTAFQHFYLRVGLIIGYIALERMFQLRLKILNKI